ncbi:response regulator [Iodidimonas gelatinilytica]|uniref:Response regulator n=1 Tax=Iodidimonas gelatinilytica TaxID=1236966 RepID=A0A5A7MUV6_9PROT|nr:response regulator [Iodidimonas gelatinilytica]GEQ99691.1 response regulator [Iodidimonas gelatinilytica]
MARLLIAEDDAAMRNFLTRSLIRAGHEVVAVEDGLKALPHITPGGFDLLLSDVAMPELDGVSLAKHAADLDPMMKVVFITGFAAIVMNRKDSDLPPLPAVLSKPFHLRDLVAVIEQLCAS